jgi:hypothetical protein
MDEYVSNYLTLSGGKKKILEKSQKYSLKLKTVLEITPKASLNRLSDGILLSIGLIRFIMIK